MSPDRLVRVGVTGHRALRDPVDPVDHDDVLVSVWDGERSHGHGGTADIVACAAERGVLLLWVKANRP
ncbi:MAG TPA: hypothetical protein VFN43_03400 [Humibacillus sp.]|nr:hypothetical protein [Humibacillus sp.]